MCRISAIVSQNTNSLRSGLALMNNSMKHGGPDGEGIYVNEALQVGLGHRRLSIIELSELGHQPMANISNDLQIVFNGEIYNYKELKAELQGLGQQFKTNSDTEVILNGYRVWGTLVLEKLKGMFAFVLLDIKKEILFAARDHAGIKPLYIAKKGGEYYFASEIRAFLTIDNGWKQNQDWRILFLTYGFIPEPFTILENVSPLEKGHYLVFNLKAKTYTTHSFFSPQYKQLIIPYADAVKQTRQLVQEAVSRHLVSDVPVGVFLSGGIDSSIITMLAQKAKQSPIETLSIYFDDEKYSENKFQQLIVDKTGVNHNSYKVTFDEFLDTWPDIYNSFDQPSVDAINTHFICKYAKRKGLKVVLSGLGADEYFGGYPSFNRSEKFITYSRLALLQNVFPTSFITYPTKKIEYLKHQINNSEYLLYRGLFTPSDVSKILDISTQDVSNTLNKIEVPSFVSTLSNKNRASYFESSIYMQSQLLKDSDVQSMWHGLELRVPFLDKDIIQFTNSLHETVKYKNGRHKPLLIDAFKEELPVEIWDRPKQGFTFPFENWFQKMNIFENNYYIPQEFYTKFKEQGINFSRLWGVFLARTYGSVSNIKNITENYKPTFLFTYLAAFNSSGGIEKVNKAILKSITNNSFVQTESWGLHDSFVDSRYFPRYAFKGFQGKRFWYIFSLLMNNKKWNQILVGHINLALPIYLLKKLNPSVKITLIVHGIDVWDKQSKAKYWLLHNADKILSVSNFTKEQLVKVNDVNPNKIIVVPNCLDVFFNPHSHITKPTYLVERYGIKPNQKIVLTLSRLKSTEKYKGYDNVIDVLAQISQSDNIDYKYLLCGTYDVAEFERVSNLIHKHNLEKQVILTGFIADDELEDHYQLADVFIMPSKKEGFGIVFIEAAASGTYVIAGNSDGSSEAMLNGQLGKLVNPDNLEEIYSALKEALLGNTTHSNAIARQAFLQYDFAKYSRNLNKILFQS